MNTDRRKMRCWAEISLDGIRYNYTQLASRLPAGCRYLGVVKADAYGHGAVEVSETLEKAGADYLAVACLDEAAKLRDAGIKLPLLILGHTPEEYTRDLMGLDLTQAVADLESAKRYSAEAEKAGGTLRCHLKLDTGMGRLGFSARRETEKLGAAAALPGLDPEGAFTHFAVSDEGDEEYTRMQFELFRAGVAEAERISGKKIKIKHCTNSGAMIKYPWTYSDMVRPGILLYGYYPCPDRGGIDVRPCMTLKTRVAQIKDMRAGESVSYGRHWTAERDSRIAVLTVGYADGLHRALSGRTEVLLRGRRVPLVGNICMDMVMADVTDVPEAEPGDEVTVFGGDSGRLLEDLAKTAGTITYELLTSVSPRVPRIY